MRRLAVLCVLLPVLGACGDDEPQAEERTVTVDPSSTVRVVGTEYSFDPERVVVRGPGTLTIRLRNEGSLAHNLRLERDGEDVGGTPTFPGGRAEQGRVDLERGRYRMVCTVGDHEELGMVGELEVR